jgi:hypothetical protein
MRHNLSIASDLEKQVDDWRARQRPIPDFTLSIDALLRLGLEQAKEARK